MVAQLRHLYTLPPLSNLVGPCWYQSSCGSRAKTLIRPVLEPEEMPGPTSKSSRTIRRTVGDWGPILRTWSSYQ